MKNLTIKMKLILSFFTVIILVAILAFFSISGINKTSDGFTEYRNMAKDTVLASQVQSNMLMARMNVKDYLISSSQKEIDEFNNYYDETKNFIEQAKNEIQHPTRAPIVEKLSVELTLYKNHFYDVINLMNQRNSIVNDNITINGKEIEESLTKMMLSLKENKEYETSLDISIAIRNLLLARLYTTKFLESNSNEDFNRVQKEFDYLINELELIKKEMNNSERISQINKIKNILYTFKSGVSEIEQIITQRNKIVESKLNVIGSNIAKLAEDVKYSIKLDQDTLGPEIAKSNENLINLITIVSFIILVLIIILAFTIPKNIATAIDSFQNGLINFFKYLNRETTEVKLLDDSSKDEFGVMAKVVNENITNTQKGIEEDRKVINDTIEVLSEFEQGDLCQRVTAQTSNPALQELTKLLNQMGSNMEDNIENVLDILEEYSNYNYLNKVETKGIKEHLLKLASGVNSLGDSITYMLIENKEIGTTLSDSSTTLLNNVNTLNDASNSAATSLEQTAAALEEITSTIVSNTNSVTEMAVFASQVIDSAKEGNDLANQTTKSMEEINKQVTSINQAISVIDQIAFQTNILSLNAAVEAATAGEAGLGFAVVAQEVRNLASRSAQAANEIKHLVENANKKTKEGINISDKMIHGYKILNENINKTIELINQVESASKEQKAGIEQINDAITQQDRQTQQIANASGQTYEIAMKTSKISTDIVKKVSQKSFHDNKDIQHEINNLKYIKEKDEDDEVS